MSEPRWIDVGSFRDIPVRGARRVDVGGRTIAVFRTATDALYAVEDRCPHRNGPLSQGIVHGDCVTCPLHNLVIGLADGVARGTDEGSVARYALRRDGDAVLLSPDVPLAPASPAETAATAGSARDAAQASERSAAA